MLGEPERGEPSTFTLWGVPGRMFTGLVGVDMSAGMKKAEGKWVTECNCTDPRTRDTPSMYIEARR